MAQTNIESLIYHLRFTSRTRVGLWRFPLAKIGHEAEIAVHFVIEGLDVSAYMRERLPNGAEFVRLSEQKVLDTLDEIASTHGKRDCVLVYNLDLLLSGVTSSERKRIWQFLFNGFPNRTRALLLVIPETADQLMPSETNIDAWLEDSRII